MELIKICERCGTEYVAPGNKSRFCPPCKKIQISEANKAFRALMRQQKAGEAAKPKPASVNEISALAKKAGMTYGQYVAKYGGKI